jgi:hypothetical protein
VIIEATRVLTEELQVNKAKAKALIANAKDVSYISHHLPVISCDPNPVCSCKFLLFPHCRRW